jgi:hypothetical protein
LSAVWLLDAGTDRRNAKPFAHAYVRLSLNGGDRMSEGSQRKIYQKVAAALMITWITFGLLQLMGWIKV